MNAPGLLIAAVRSGAGKTTFSLGLMRALTRKEIKVGAVKCGPDYIDPAFHAAATGRESLNLDSWAMTQELVMRLAASAGEQADIVIAEGAMGLFDGAPGDLLRNGSIRRRCGDDGLACAPRARHIRARAVRGGDRAGCRGFRCAGVARRRRAESRRVRTPSQIGDGGHTGFGNSRVGCVAP